MASPACYSWRNLSCEQVQLIVDGLVSGDRRKGEGERGHLGGSGKGIQCVGGQPVPNSPPSDGDIRLDVPKTP